MPSLWGENVGHHLRWAQANGGYGIRSGAQCSAKRACTVGKGGNEAGAQQAHHGDADPVVPYQGGPRFGSKVWILDSEPQSDATWAKHNGCKGPLVQPRNYTATYTSKDPETRGQTIQTTAIYRKYEGCPPTAPVEWCAACLASLPRAALPRCYPEPQRRVWQVRDCWVPARWRHHDRWSRAFLDRV